MGSSQTTDHNIATSNLPIKIVRRSTKRKRQAKKPVKRIRKKPAFRKVNVDNFCDDYGSLLGRYLTEFNRMKLLQHKMKKQQYSNFQKFLAVNIMIGTSIRSYKFLSNILPLPCSETVLRTLRKMKSMPGVTPQNAKMLRLKVNPQEAKDKLTWLLMDEMSIRKGLAYDKSSDIIYGFKDDGKKRENVLASSSLVVMAVGVCKKWKFPVGYFFTEKVMTAESIITVVQEAITILENEGFNVVGITTDQGSNFERAFRLMGASQSNPRISVGSKTYYVHRDPPHLLKNARNYLEKADVSVPNMGNKASWRHIIELYKKDSQSSLRMVPKLTERHIFNLRFSSKMKVKLAAQVFSHTTAAALETLCAKGELKPDSLATSNLIRKFNDVFDCLNSSSSKDSVRLRRPISTNSKIVEFLKDSYEWLDRLEKRNEKRKCTFIKGFRQSIQVVLQLIDDLTKKGVPFLSTRNLCQDGLELFFGKIRYISKYPDCYNFMNNYAKIATASLIKEPTTGNCEAADSENHLRETISFMTTVSVLIIR